MDRKMKYRLAVDLGSTSIGWAMVRIKQNDAGKFEPNGIITSGVRIFSDGRDAKGNPLAVTRRKARAMRRRRDRLLKRKARMLQQLTHFGFFPTDLAERKALETLNPYELRAKGLDEALSPYEFGRALFHINQRRGFKSNRKTDKKENDSGALKAAIKFVHSQIDGNTHRTVGELLYKRMLNGDPVRARLRITRIESENGKPKILKKYDLYIDRDMVKAEFEALWSKQASLNPEIYHEEARANLIDVLFFQRKLRPGLPGRCTLIPTEERAPLALPSSQRFRMYQEVYNLRTLCDGLEKDDGLTQLQRNQLIEVLEKKPKLTFNEIKSMFGLGKNTKFNLEELKDREALKGNSTSVILSRAEFFGERWFQFDEAQQEEIVLKILNEENESYLIAWLVDNAGVDSLQAEAISYASLPEGYGSLSRTALAKILPALRTCNRSYSDAVKAAGFEHHSNIGPGAAGEILPELPYYGEALQRHVGFGTGNPDDTAEKRYGKIANPTVHVALNQFRIVVNELIEKYGHPSEVVIEVARELKKSKKQRLEESRLQSNNEKNNDRIRNEISGLLGISKDRVSRKDIQKWILWEELSANPADRKCPYSGVQISPRMLLSNEVEIEHILPFSITMENSINNKTVSIRRANQIKGNQTPWEAFGKPNALGVDYSDILMRVKNMPEYKQFRFADNSMERWNKEGEDYLARHLNDTRYISRIAAEYVTLICPGKTRVIPGRMTALLRVKLGLNSLLGLSGEKNRHDHRHHAIDACVIGITDQAMLQRFAEASASARKKGLSDLVENMPEPWPNYIHHVKRAIENLYISHKPDHNYQGAFCNDTAYAIYDDGYVGSHKIIDGKRVYVKEKLAVIPIASNYAIERHGRLPNGDPRAYKGYKGDSNYCIEIVRNETGKWRGEVISTYEAYQAIRNKKRQCDDMAILRNPNRSLSEKSLVMRLMRNDTVCLIEKNQKRIMRVCNIRSNGSIKFADIKECNVDARVRKNEFSYLSKTAGELQKLQARQVTVSPIGRLRDPGFKP